jgi:hypothetical protein
MSDSITVRVTLDSYDIVHPSEKQTQVYVQIPEVARTSWLLDAEFFSVLKDEPWPHVVDTAREAYERRGTVSDSDSAAARAAIVKWLSDDANHDAMNEAWFQDRARRDPVSRSLLKDKERLTARVAELEAQREALAERLLAGQRWERGRDPELVSENFVSQSELRSIFGIPLAPPWADGITRRIAPVQALRDDEPAAVLTVFRASWDSLILGHYTTAEAAREHCKKRALRDLPSVSLDWIEDEEDGVAELVGSVGEEERPLGYIVTTVGVASAYDEEADE